MDNNLLRYVWRNSWREQVIVLLVIAISIPFSFASFDVPKRIVNDAILGKAFRDGHQTLTLFDLTIRLPDFLGGHTLLALKGFEFDQVGTLLTLSFLFLALVLINGGLKYIINVRKGILGERMLRRMRYDLVNQLMRFRPEDIRAVKPAEIASMIKDEVEPIGAFVGDAFIQPAFLGTQALTALAFIMIQNFWLGFVALFIVLIQAIVIPILRREQLRLGRERQLASRRLAGRIGEIVDAAPAIQGHGMAAYIKADISGRLGNLFNIRFALYRRKFAVKFLNNLLAQITPFFFYSIGGYFALKGQLDIGQLVAVIAAYRDLPPPIKELIDWDQQRNDVIIKYEQVAGQFAPAEVLELEDESPAEPVQLAPDGPIRLDQVQVSDSRGQPLLEPLSLLIERPSRVALVGAIGSGRDALGRVLGRQTTAYRGRVMVGGHDLSALSVEAASRIIGYAGSDVEVLQGSLRDNFALSLKRHRPGVPDGQKASAARRRAVMEALRSGNTPLSFEADWIDYAGAGIAAPDDLDPALRRVLEVLGLDDDVYELGLNGRLFLSGNAVADRKVREARAAIAEELRAMDLKGLIETFDPSRYNSNASIGENFLFGAVKGERFANENLLTDPFAGAILRAEALVEPLINIGGRIVSTLSEIFSGLPAGHQLFERYRFGQDLDMEGIQTLAAAVEKGKSQGSYPLKVQRELTALAFGYVEAKYRLNLVEAPLRQRMLRARESFQHFLPAGCAADIEFYDPGRIIHGATVRDNILFGRVGYNFPDAAARVSRVVKSALARAGLDADIYQLGLNTDTGINGRYLPTRLRYAIPLVRALIKRPDIYVLDLTSLMSVIDWDDEVIARLATYCEGRTSVVLVADESLAEGADLIVEFDGTRGQVKSGASQRANQGDETIGAEASRRSEREPASIGAAE